jgi:hypothetical protein
VTSRIRWTHMCARRGAGAAGVGRAESLTELGCRGGVAVAVRAAGVSGTGARRGARSAPERTPRVVAPPTPAQTRPPDVAGCLRTQKPPESNSTTA